MPWILLIVAGLFEVGWAIGLKYTEGFTRPLPTVADRALDGRSASGSSAWRCATCRSAPPTRSGPASARSAPRRSASCSSATRRRAGRLACIGLIVAGIVGLKLVA